MKAISWWRRPWDRCRYQGHVIWTKSGYVVCRRHEHLTSVAGALWGEHGASIAFTAERLPESHVKVAVYRDGELAFSPVVLPVSDQGATVAGGGLVVVLEPL